MSYKLHILKKSNKLVDLIYEIEKTVDETVKRISQYIDLPDIDIVVSSDKYSAVPGKPTGGYNPTAHVLYIYINTELDDFEKLFNKHLISTLTHELHHASRRMHLGDIGAYGKLINGLVSEGLAEYFDFEINGTIQSQAKSVSKEKINELREDVMQDYEKGIHETNWIRGSEKEDIPFQFGYAYGFDLISRHIEKNPEETAASLVNQPAELFI